METERDKFYNEMEMYSTRFYISLFVFVLGLILVYSWNYYTACKAEDAEFLWCAMYKGRELILILSGGYGIYAFFKKREAYNKFGDACEKERELEKQKGRA